MNPCIRVLLDFQDDKYWRGWARELSLLPSKSCSIFQLHICRPDCAFSRSLPPPRVCVWVILSKCWNFLKTFPLLYCSCLRQSCIAYACDWQISKGRIYLFSTCGSTNFERYICPKTRLLYSVQCTVGWCEITLFAKLQFAAVRGSYCR